MYLAKKESLGECQLSEFSAQSPSKRQRISSPSSSDINVTDAVSLQTPNVNVAACPITDMKCAVETFADLSQVIHLLGTGSEVLGFLASQFEDYPCPLQC